MASSTFFARRLLPALAIVAAGWLVFQPALSGGWLWDDNILVTDHVELRNLPGLEKIWTAKQDWPLTMTLFWIEWQVWGKHPAGYHVCNLALHLACGLLVWRLFSRLGLRWAWLGGLLFVVHPLAVETTAWISETKNTLSLLFFLLSLDAWLDYDGKGGRRFYALSLFLYLAALLAKTSVVMLPAVLLLHAWWKRGRIERREIAEMIPYVLIAMLFGARTLYLQSHDGIGADPQTSGGLLTRLADAPVAWLFYLGKFLAPVGLLPVYPRWREDGFLPVRLFLPVAALVLGGWWIARRKWGGHAALGLGFFTLNLFPVLGILWMKYLNVSPVADHFVYLPMIGLIGLAVAGLEQIEADLKPVARPWGLAAVAVVMLVLALGSRAQAGLFVDRPTLWAHTLAHNPDAWPALNDLGNDLLAEGRVAEALEAYRRALKDYPESTDVLTNLGNVSARMGRLAEAERDYREALRVHPDELNAHIGLGNVFLQTGRTDEAVAQYQLALDLDPDSTDARYNLGNALQQEGHFPEAAQQYGLALAGRPRDAAIWTNLGAALQEMGRASEAMDDYQKALQIDPQSAEAHASLGSALQQAGKIPEAVAQYEIALQINPGLADVRHDLKLLEDSERGAPVSK
jgi:tetratricopeptide (TPR) repeat protein